MVVNKFFLLLNTITLYGYIIIYLSIDLLMHVLVTYYYTVDYPQNLVA